MSETEKNKFELSLKWYIAHRPTFKKLSLKIENILIEVLELQTLSYHMITSRAKDIDSYKTKINNPKYDDPINQITDLAGIRIITYVEDEVEKVCSLIEAIFDIDRENSSDKSKDLGIDRVGYKSVHYVAKLKSDRLSLPEYGLFKDKWFEIQVRTILQHAWAEIEHDRNYKFTGKLPDEISRRFKLLAGALEMSDREFNSIAKDIDNIASLVKKGTSEGKLDFQLNSTSLTQYVATKFRRLTEEGFTIKLSDDKKLFEDLEGFGIMTLEDLDKLVPADYIQTILDSEKETDKIINENGIIRAMMIINNTDKYFTTAKKSSWKKWTHTDRFEKLFRHYNVDWNKIEEKYAASFN